MAVDAFKTPLIVDSRFGDVQIAAATSSLGPGVFLVSDVNYDDYGYIDFDAANEGARYTCWDVIDRLHPRVSRQPSADRAPRGPGEGYCWWCQAERTAHEGKPAFCGWDSARTARRDREMRAFAAIPRTDVRLLPGPLVGVEGLSHAQRILHILGDKRLSWVVIGVVI